jgi:hypothetical protein
VNEGHQPLVGNFEHDRDASTSAVDGDSPDCWSVAGVTVRGASHVANDSGCQDYHRGILLSRGAHNWIIAAVSDGAGSAPHSALGANIATNVFCATLRECIDRDPYQKVGNHLGRLIVQEIKDRLTAKAEEKGCVVRDLACTLLGIVIGPYWTAYLQIGDGAIVRRTASEWEVVEWPQRGEYANTTHFVSDGDAEERVCFRCEEIDKAEAPVTEEDKVERAIEHPIKEYALFTDGIQDLVLDNQIRKPHKKFFEFIFREWRERSEAGVDERQQTRLTTLLLSPEVQRRTDDDLTLVTVIAHAVASDDLEATKL